MKKFSLSLIALWLAAMAHAQTTTVCTKELARTDDCADVINANACYNEYRFSSGTQALQCIGGKDNTERAKKACKCCSCVGTVMCDWVTKNKYCS